MTVVSVVGALVLVGLLLLGVDRFSTWQADREFEKGQKACREQVMARGVQPSDYRFDVAVAMCNLNR